jgi:hypothetical protein
VTTSYQQWATAHGVDGTSQMQLADEDHDGVSKFLEFSFNLNPNISDNVIQNPISQPNKGLPRMIMNPATSTTGTQLSLQYICRADVPGLVYQAQFSSDLINFSNATNPPTEEILSANWKRMTVIDSVGAGSKRRFGRVNVSFTPTP